MKNAMKKIFSLMLVAVLLVSALPFAAFADAVPYYMVVLSSDNSQLECEGLEVGVSNSISSFIPSGYEYDFGQHRSANGNITELADPFEVVEGDVIVIAVKAVPASEPETSEPEASEPEASEPEASEPAESKPEASEPEASEPAESKPEASEPEASEPAESKPEASEPEASEPEETEHRHSYDDGEITTAPTCTEKGVKTFTCACGATKTETIAKLGHSYDDGVVTTPATCTKKGVKTFTCANCGATKTEDIAKLGHDLQNNKCTRCSYVKTEIKVEAPKEKYFVRFVVDNEEFCCYTVVDGNTVKNPGTSNDIDYKRLNKVGDTDNRVFLGWARNVDATKADFSTATVVIQPINSSRTYYAIYQDVAVDPPTSSRPGNITNKDNTNKVYLHVYLNGNASVIQTTRDITETALLDDDKISAAEIHTYLTKTLQYYGPKDTTLGVQIDGLYVNTGVNGTFPQNYYTDNKVADLNNVSALLDNGYVHINVMMKNVAVSSNPSYTADSSNPKTGDMIFAPAMVLGLSVSALAVLFFLNKKRAY